VGDVVELLPIGEGAEAAVVFIRAAKAEPGVDAAMDIAEDMICAAASILASETDPRHARQVLATISQALPSKRG
jgi:hypothetical protein